MARKTDEELVKMSIWEHMDAFRFLLLRSGVVVVLLAIAMFILMPQLFESVIMAPCRPDFPLYELLEWMSRHLSWMPEFAQIGIDVEVVNIRLASQFFVHMSLSMWSAFILAFPFILWQLWLFISPGLYVSERSGTRKAFLIGNLLFYFGIAIGYFLVFPLALRFLADYHLSPTIANVISFDSYMDNFVGLIFAMGIVCELPLLAWLLGKVGIIDRSIFAKFRRHAIVGLLIIAAFITPTGDPFTLIVVFLPLYMLWEVGALLVPRINHRNLADGGDSVNNTIVPDRNEPDYTPIYRRQQHD